jgi:fatty-acyl-CoA synthase
MAWGFRIYACCLDQTWCYPLLIYSQKLIKILEDEKVTKANGVPTIWLGIYDAMKKIHQKQLALEEYIVGGSALPKSLIEGFEKIWN